MPKTKKKVVPITLRIDQKGERFKKSSAETARRIRRFHVLNKELAKCRADKALGHATREKEILAEMEAMGGLDWYQRASQLGQSKRRGGDSSKWLIQTIEKKGLRKPSMRVLEVGAVSPDNYAPYKSWIEVTPIDLNPQDPRIKKQDFLKMPPSRTFDVVSLSLVVNFVGDPKERGKNGEGLGNPVVSH
ncbi:putative methyltransferase-domain-containing protein [Dichotomocladium elegans]|nr:putative methyltransferase-domain-containing protein [Dichotomocladium elegans]